MNQERPSLQRLLYRRGYLLGHSEFKPTDYWQSWQLDHGLVLSAHSDLQVTVIRNEGSSIVLIGIAVDALAPKQSLNEIAQKILFRSKNIREVIDNTYSLAGRWLIIYQDQNRTYMFTDPCGFRQVFYFSTCDGVWCSSQPEIIRAVHSMEWRTDKDVISYLFYKDHVVGESVWIGNQTIYEGCYHLIPNHYLEVDQAKQVRFYPETPLPKMQTASIIESAAATLHGIYEGIAGQQEVLQALTGGWDSRILLAASKNHTQNIEYYMDRMGILSNWHKDVWVPKLLAKKLKINFHVENSKYNPPGWFISILSQNVTGARVLPKTRPIFTNLKNNEERISINGNGSEICRSWYDQYCIGENNKLDSNLLPGIHGFYNSPYVIKIIDEWKEDLYSLGGKDRNVLDMLYWEQRLGNWGALYPSERDITIEEFSPFNCRLLIDTMFSSERHLRSAPRYELSRMLVQAMWPETLTIPINPFSRRPGTRIWKRKLRRYIPTFIKNSLRW